MLVQERDQRNRDFRERNREARKREGQNPRGERQSLAEVCVCFRAPPGAGDLEKLGTETWWRVWRSRESDRDLGRGGGKGKDPDGEREKPM